MDPVGPSHQASMVLPTRTAPGLLLFLPARAAPGLLLSRAVMCLQLPMAAVEKKRVYKVVKHIRRLTSVSMSISVHPVEIFDHYMPDWQNAGLFCCTLAMLIVACRTSAQMNGCTN